MTRRTFSVDGMACDGCEATVVDALAAIDGVGAVAADHERDRVELDVDGDVDDDAVVSAIEAAGYEVVG